MNDVKKTKDAEDPSYLLFYGKIVCETDPWTPIIYPALSSGNP